MTVHHKRRRRKKPEAVVEEEVPRRRPVKARKPVVPEIRRPKGIRPIYLIAKNLFDAYPDFGKKERRNKVYLEFRELFCIAYADQTHTQIGENAEPIKEWTGREVIENFLAGTKTMRKKAVQSLRAELARHLDYLPE